MAPAPARALGFPVVWLRHNCPCPDCRDPVTAQRLVEITQLSNGPFATVTAERDDSDLSLFPAAPFTFLSVLTTKIGQIGRNSGQNR